MLEQANRISAAAPSDAGSHEAILAALAALKSPLGRRVEAVANAILEDPAKPSRTLARNQGMTRDDLVTVYRAIQALPAIQEWLIRESGHPSLASFLARQLEPDCLSHLERVFAGGLEKPMHVEFQLAPTCNLRCRYCPNMSADRQFVKYPLAGHRCLSSAALRHLIDALLDMGIRGFTWSGGGEPTLVRTTFDGIRHARQQDPEVNLALYTNGVFPAWLTDEHWRTMAACLDKVRFSVDALDRRSWSDYKGRPAEGYDRVWLNIRRLARLRKALDSGLKIGVSCLASRLTSDRDVRTFLRMAQDAGVDFCDLKETEISDYAAAGPTAKPYTRAMLRDVARKGAFGTMHVAVNEGLLQKAQPGPCEARASQRCWWAIAGRNLTVGPFGEVYPCSDAANPGCQKAMARPLCLGLLNGLGDARFAGRSLRAVWKESQVRRLLVSQRNCPYCVPSHRYFNASAEKLFQDWQYGIALSDQPFAGRDKPREYDMARGRKGPTRRR